MGREARQGVHRVLSYYPGFQSAGGTYLLHKRAVLHTGGITDGVSLRRITWFRVSFNLSCTLSTSSPGIWVVVIRSGCM
jgi:hypothetical protein